MGDLSAAALHDLLERVTHAKDQVDRWSIRAADDQKPGKNDADAATPP